ncbi:MAG: ribosomal protein S18-alanine N-acetyltransferase [bacterium]
MLPITIREMREDDIADVLSIEIENSPSPWTRVAFYEELCKPHSLVRVAVCRGKIVGYICASLVIDEGHILNLSVHSIFRRMGIAKRLVHDVLSSLREKGCTKIFLEVRASNRIAIEVYSKFHFIVTGRRRDYYRNPLEDAILMEYTFPGE